MNTNQWKEWDSDEEDGNNLKSQKDDENFKKNNERRYSIQLYSTKKEIYPLLFDLLLDAINSQSNGSDSFKIEQQVYKNLVILEKEGKLINSTAKLDEIKEFEFKAYVLMRTGLHLPAIVEQLRLYGCISPKDVIDRMKKNFPEDCEQYGKILKLRNYLLIKSPPSSYPSNPSQVPSNPSQVPSNPFQTSPQVIPTQPSHSNYTPFDIPFSHPTEIKGRMVPFQANQFPSGVMYRIASTQFHPIFLHSRSENEVKNLGNPHIVEGILVDVQQHTARQNNRYGLPPGSSFFVAIISIIKSY